MDEAIVRALTQGAESPAVAVLAQLLSSPVILVLTAVPIGAWLIAKKRWWAIASIALSMGASDAANARILKPLIARERPCRALKGLLVAAPCGVGMSFASGHAAVAFAFVVSAGAAAGWTLPILAPLAVLVSASRVVLGQHYPSDVASGAVLGASIGFAFEAARRKIDRTAECRLSTADSSD